jgi:hypothetical protein
MNPSLPARASDLGPADDPDDSALDAIYDDDEFQAKFCTEHAWQLVDLIHTSHPDLREIKARALNEAFEKALWAEFKNRRDNT